MSTNQTGHENAPSTEADRKSPRDQTSPDGSPVSSTRTGAVWVATAVSLVLLVLLIIFVLQNLTRVEVSFLGFDGSPPLGMALLVAAVAGGIVVAAAGVARVMQLRRRLRQVDRAS